MGQKRNNYSAKFKLQVVNELMYGEKTQSQITSEYGVHPNQQNRWRKHFIENAETIFEDNRQKQNKDKENEKLVESLYKQLGKVTVEKEWLEKKIRESPTIFGKS